MTQQIFKALPSTSQVHVNVPLTNIAEKYYLGDQDIFIAGKVFPQVPVGQISGIILRYCRKDFFMATQNVRPRAPGAKAQRGGFHVDWNSTYFCREYAFGKEIFDEDRANSTPPIDLDRDATQFITQNILLKREELWSAAAMVAANWPIQGVFAAGAWNLAAATPITDVMNAKLRMHLGTGFQPNTLVINKQTFYYLRQNPQIVAIYRNLGSAEPKLSVAQVADALDIERLLVSQAVHDVGPMEGQWDGRSVVPNDALLCYTASAPSTMQPSAGYTFGFTGANHTGLNVQIEQYRGEEDSKKDITVGNIHFDVQLVESDLGVYFPNCVAGAGILNQVVLDVPICL